MTRRSIASLAHTILVVLATPLTAQGGGGGGGNSQDPRALARHQTACREGSRGQSID